MTAAARPFSFRTGCVLAVLAGAADWSSAALIDKPSSSWTPITFSAAGQVDYADDQQTGDGSSDIVGDANNPSLYTMMYLGDEADPTDGNLMFRARMGEEGTGGTFNRNLFIGVDADLDGSLDAYLGIHNQGSFDELALYSAGTDTNTSPNTTSITGPTSTYSETAVNYKYAAVDTTDTDVDADGNTDWHVSFAIPFNDLVTLLAADGIVIDDTSPLAFVMATATQDNSLNQDINGVPKNYNGNTSWTDLGAMSDPIVPSSTATPEPTSLALMAVASVFACGYSRRRRRSSVAFND